MAREESPEDGPHFEDRGESASNFLLANVMVTHHDDAIDQLVDSISFSLYRTCVVYLVESTETDSLKSHNNPTADSPISQSGVPQALLV